MKWLLVSLAGLLTPEAAYEPDYLRFDAPTDFGGKDPQYVACVELISDDLVIGRAGARAWVQDGGGAPAVHCLAIADLAAGYPKRAAIRLMELGESPSAGESPTRARVLASAALAFLEAERPDFAIEAVEAAESLEPDLSDIHIVAAKAYAAAEEWQAAADAASKAEAANFATAETYVIRAKARRALGKDLEAAEDIVEALKRDPFDLDALVLRGELIQAGIDIRARYAPADETGAPIEE
ncbi:MAG: hypothetical protein AAF224_02315 [Pseudomonadota bacterium]